MQDRPFAARLRHGPLERRHGTGVDHGSKEDVPLGGISDPQGRGPLDQLLEERPRHPLMYVHPRRGAALLVLQSERRPRDSVRRGVQIRRLHDDRGVLASHLEQARLDPAGREPPVDPQPDRFRAGEHDAVHARVTPQRFAGFGTGPGQEVEHTRRQPRVAVDLVQLEPGPRRLLRRLVDDGISGHQRRARHAGRECEGEVERRDAREYAVRSQHVHVVLDGRDLGHLTHEAVRVLQLLAVVVQQVRRFLGVAHRFDSALPHLEAHDRGELELAFADELRRPPHQRAALPPTAVRPGGLRHACRADGAVHLLVRSRGEAAEHDRRVAGRPVDDRLGSRAYRLARDVERVIPSQLPSHTRQRGVELTVKQLPIDVGGRVGDLELGGSGRGQGRPPTPTAGG